MRLFCLTIERTKAVPPSLSNIDSNRGWFPLIRESFAGAWQRNIVEQTPENILTFSAVYACVTLIASDVGKLRIQLVERDEDGIWSETENPAYSPVLRSPNHFQIDIDFYQTWVLSKLIHGNTYVLKQRDQRGVVTALYVLDPTRVRPMVAPNQDVYYALDRDDLAGAVSEQAIVPAREIIHDVMAQLYHPLCGVSPITACGLAAMQGLRIQQHSSDIFQNGAQPGGLLTTAGTISAEKARDMQRLWEENYGGQNAGRIAVLGADLKYQPLGMMNATDAQLIEQLKLSAEMVCTAFHVPPYMVGVGPPPNYNNIEALSVQYYAQCLQIIIEKIERLLNHGLGLPKHLGTHFNLDDLMRMDTQTRSKVSADAVGAGVMSPNESRRRHWNLPPVDGGNSPFLQQQNYSLEALAKRDAKADPFSKGDPPDDPSPSDQPDDPDDTVEDVEREAADLFAKEWAA